MKPANDPSQSNSAARKIKLLAAITVFVFELYFIPICVLCMWNARYMFMEYNRRFGPISDWFYSLTMSIGIYEYIAVLTNISLISGAVICIKFLKQDPLKSKIEFAKNFNRIIWMPTLIALVWSLFHYRM